MTTVDIALERLWQRMDKRRADGEVSLLRFLAEMVDDAEFADVAEPLVASLLVHPKATRHLADHVTPEFMAQFVGQLVARLGATSVLDPMCGLGLMLRAVVDAAQPKLVHGIEVAHECHRISSRILRGRAHLFLGDAFSQPEGMVQAYDFILLDPPPANRALGSEGSARGSSSRFLTDLIRWALERLAPGGHVAVLVSRHQVRDMRFRDGVRNVGAQIRALVQFPAGSSVSGYASSYLVLIDRDPQQQVFLGQAQPEARPWTDLLGNLVARREGPDPALGALRDLDGFTSFEQVDSLHRLAQKVSGSTLHQVRVRDILEVQRFNMSDLASPKATEMLASYLCLTEDGKSFEPEFSLGSRSRMFIGLKLKPGAVDPEFFRHWLRSESWQLIMKANRGGSPMSPLQRPSFLDSYLPIPSFVEQQKLAVALRTIHRVRRDLDDIESACWSGRESEASIQKRIDDLTSDKGDEHWIEVLPYPLGSILWKYKAESRNDVRVRVRVLCTFFEALAAFLATIHLSALKTNEVAWRARAPEIVRRLARANLCFKRATFGMWKCIVEQLASQARGLLYSRGQGGEAEFVKEMYSFSDARMLAALCSPEISSILAEANAVRNLDAHGYADSVEMERRLQALIVRLRTQLGDLWATYELVQAGSSEFDGGIYKHSVLRVTGTRTPFVPDERHTLKPLVSKALYMMARGERKGLRLLPFLVMKAPPNHVKDACYFFSKVEQQGMHFVSYNYDASVVSEAMSEFEASVMRDLTSASG